MTVTTEATAGPFWAGEIPEPTDLTVADSDGVIRDCIGATSVTFKYSVDNGTTQTGTAAPQDLPNGVFRITWSAAAIATPGVLRGVCYFTLNGARLVAGVVHANIKAPPVPIT